MALVPFRSGRHRPARKAVSSISTNKPLLQRAARRCGWTIDQPVRRDVSLAPGLIARFNGVMNAAEYSISAATAQQVVDFFDEVRGLYPAHSRPPALLDVGSRAWDEALVVAHEGQIVGAVTLAFNDIDRPAPGTLDTLYVMPEHRRRGLGCRLCEMALLRFIKAGWTPVFCHATTQGMRRIIECLPSELKQHLTVRRSHNDEFFDPEIDHS